MGNKGEYLYFHHYFYECQSKGNDEDRIEKFKFRLEKKYCSYDGYMYLYLILSDDEKYNSDRQYDNEKYFNQRIYCRPIYDKNSQKSYIGNLLSKIKIVR